MSLVIQVRLLISMSNQWTKKISRKKKQCKKSFKFIVEMFSGGFFLSLQVQFCNCVSLYTWMIDWTRLSLLTILIPRKQKHQLWKSSVLKARCTTLWMCQMHAFSKLVRPIKRSFNSKVNNAMPGGAFWLYIILSLMKKIQKWERYCLKRNVAMTNVTWQLAVNITVVYDDNPTYLKTKRSLRPFSYYNNIFLKSLKMCFFYS